MSDKATVEERLTHLEALVADLQRQVSRNSQPENWLDAITGSISDEEAFLQALQYGREFRESDRLQDRTT